MSDSEKKPQKIVPQGETTKAPDKSKPNDQISDDQADGAAGGAWQVPGAQWELWKVK